MRSRIIPAVGAGVAALALAVAYAPVAGAAGHAVGIAGHNSGKTAHQFTVPAKNCFTNMNNDNGNGVNSQNFESSFDAYDDQGAADFKAKRCKIKTVQVAGVYFNGSGPARDENVFIYKGGKSHPGKLVKEFDGLKGTDSAGSFTITLPKTVKAKKGTYWVSVQANLDFSAGGEWGWELSSDQPGKPDVWQNPGGGFGVCPTWDTVAVCIAGATGDYMVALS
jgi:hypothetical protein